MPQDLNVLLVEDNPQDMQSYLRDFPAIFVASGINATIHPAASFDAAYALIGSSHIRYDLILSDTFRGDQAQRDAAVIGMVNKYREGRFCPLVVFSASARPDLLAVGVFVAWADKSVNGEIESTIRTMLSTGVSQLARRLHDELDQTAGGFLWRFLETNWERLWPDGVVDQKVLERLIRRRAALQLAEATNEGGRLEPVTTVSGLEYYVYPPLHLEGYKLGQIVCKRDQPADLRVVLTPHCHLHVQPGQEVPRAEYVLTVAIIKASLVLGDAKIQTARQLNEQGKDKKLRVWSTPPSGDAVGKPEGRYWFLPAFLDIPHAFCDFQRLESLKYDSLNEAYRSIAILTPPFAESLQACFVAYYAGVGIPNIKADGIRSLLA